MIDSRLFDSAIKTRTQSGGQPTASAGTGLDKSAAPLFERVLDNLIKTKSAQAAQAAGSVAATGGAGQGANNDVAQPETAQPSGAANAAGGVESAAKPNNHGFDYKGIREGMLAEVNSKGSLLVYRDPGGDIDLNSKGVYSAFTGILSESMWPDAAGMIDGKVAPGLEGWVELAEQPGGQGQYRGMKGYLNAHYPGGYDRWAQDFEALRRNILLGEENSVDIRSTRGIA